MAYALTPKGARPSGDLIVAGQRIHLPDVPIINWTQPPYWDATKEVCIPTITDPNPSAQAPPNCSGLKQVPYGKLPLGPYTQRLSTRPALRSYYSSGKTPPIDAVKAVIKKFVVHHDGCNSADMCFSVLQNERGLSVHFLLDNDGWIYQTCDLALMAYHASEWNTDSIGVEMCSRGDAKKEPSYYSGGRFGPSHPVIPCRINGHTILSFDYTEEQYRSFIALCRALTRILPNIPSEFPQAAPGKQLWDTMPYAKTFGFSGYIGHYHLTAQKWDPGAFEFETFCRKLRGTFCFPMFSKEDPKRSPDDIPAIPNDPGDLKEATKDLYKANEVRADGGFFPVGPWGEARLWHGGVHLAAKEGEPVRAPFPGRLVAARMGKTSAVGSVNFVLLRHNMSLGASRVQFYSLYMHLDDELKRDKRPDWMSKEGWTAKGKPGEVVLLDEPIEAAMVIGHVGKAGPPDLSRGQIHCEFFSTSELFVDLPSSPWKSIDGTSGGRFCDVKEIDDAIDSNHDGALSRQELSSFYSGGGGDSMHFLVTQHVSEWTADPSWSEALRADRKEFPKYKPAELDQMVAEQITPGLWWDATTAAHCKLPPDGVVYHYHPVSFLGWFNQQLLDAAANPTNKIDPSTASEVPAGITDDFGDKLGTSMRSAANVSDDECNKKLGLQEMVQGFDAPECGQ
jgi:N-acetylmuramoyl-L-alanine amidase